MRNVKRRAAVVLAVLASFTVLAGPAHAELTSSTSVQTGFIRGR